MRSKQLALERYNTDKILEWYDPVLQPLMDREVKLLEIGIDHGGSLLLWRDYFPRGTIVGIDLRLPDTLADEKRIHIFQGDQKDTAFLSKVASQTAPEGFDIIIDDASHLGELTKVTFWHLFDHHLKPAGWYVVEDWGTGYWDDWPDGRTFRPRSRLQSMGLKMLSKLRLACRTPWHTHNYGMVGFVKDLIDEQGIADLTRARSTGVAARESKFDHMVIMPSIVFLKKRSD
jgi:hypothetical protein